MDRFLFLAFAVLSRMTNEVKFSLMAILFGVPLYFAAFAERTPLNAQLTAISLAIVAYMALGLYVQAMKGWNEILPLLDRLADGDLTAKFSTIDRVGQFVETKNLAGQISTHLSKIVTQANSGAERITVAAHEIAAGTANLSSRTEVQASTLEETASTMEGISRTVKGNAESCKVARTLAQHASEIAANGRRMVGEMARTMTSFQESASRVGATIGAIEGIAFQTNILALNAAVEAARAGERGRGFAVVAGEVRTLAQRSAEAAKEIKELIETSTAEVSEGGQIVDQTAEIITEVVMVVGEVAQRIGEIAAASQQQSAGVDEINRALTLLEEATRENAAIAEQASAGTISLEEEARRLVASVHKFKLQ